MSNKALPSIWPNVYCEMLPAIRRVAREHGYAIGIHGSMVTDCDLIAVPWIEQVSPAATLAAAIKAVLNGWEARDCPSVKPHGRLVFSFSLDPTHYIDLSVMSRCSWSPGPNTHPETSSCVHGIGPSAKGILPGNALLPAAERSCGRLPVQSAPGGHEQRETEGGAA